MSGRRNDKRSILTNVAWNWVGYGSTVVIAFLLAPFLIRELGDARYGIFALVEHTAALLLLLELGVGASVVRYVAKFEATDETDQLNRIFSTSVAIFAVAGLLVLLAALGIAFLSRHPLGVPAEHASVTRWLLVLLGANAAISLPMGVFTSTLYGLGRFPAKTAIEASLRVATAIGFVVVVRSGGGLLELGWILLAATALKGLLSAVAARAYLPTLRFSARLVDRPTMRLVRGYSGPAFVILIAGRAATWSDAVIISNFLTPEFVTYYVVAARLVQYTVDFMRSATDVLTPVVSATEARGDREALRRLLFSATRYAAVLVMPITLGLVMLGESFLTLWLDAEHALESAPPLVILCIPLTLQTAVLSVCSRILYGTGTLGWFSVFAVSQTVLNIAVSIALVGRLGIEGVAIGTAVGFVAYAAAAAVHTCRYLEVPVGRYVLSSLGPALALGVLPPAVWWALERVVAIDGWAVFVAVGAAGVAVYAVAVQLAGLNPLRSRTKLARDGAA